MPKLKRCKSIAKRVKITGRGKIKMSKAGRRHLLSSKSAKRKRQLRKPVMISGPYVKTIKRALLKKIT